MSENNSNTKNKKRVIFQFRLTIEEKERLIEQAKESGMTATDFVKVQTLDKLPWIHKANPDREIFIKLLAELGKVGSNLNQIARVMNTEKKTFYSVAVKETLVAAVLHEIKTASSDIIKQLNHGHTRKTTGAKSTVSQLPDEEG